MFPKRPLQTQVIVLLVALTVAILAGCAARKELKRPPEEGVVLEYRMPEGQLLRYRSIQKMDQKMELMGQQTDVKADKTLEFLIESKGRQGDNYQLTITIESMEAGIDTEQGDFDADTEGVIGKSFDMTISYLGKEIDLSGADAIEYGVGPQGMRNMEPDFMAFFFDVAEGPVKIGDTWMSQDTIVVEEGDLEIYIISESANTLAGFETIKGMNCAKVEAEVIGAVSGEGQEGEASITFEGTLEGMETWYFAYEKGLFVKSLSDLFLEATIAVIGPSEMTIPMSQKMKFETKLIE